MTPSAQADFERYEALCHAMQSGVAYDQGTNPPQPDSTKHLRTGINNALVINGAIVDLLYQKGIFTEAEYARALADGMQREVERRKK